MRIYLADLTHDYLKNVQYTPTGIGFLAAYAELKLGDRVDIRLFKSVTKLLDAVERQAPDLVGLSNYTWNGSLSSFAGRAIREKCPDLPIVMGGPNIRLDDRGIETFLEAHEFVDKYCMYAAEVAFSQIAEYLLSLPEGQRTGRALRSTVVDGCYSLDEGRFSGNSDYRVIQDLDEIPSPFLNGSMDAFLADGCIPILETNRGCPFSCTFCVWGISALNKLRRFSMDRVKADLDYVCGLPRKIHVISLADANFGILSRDAEIARHIRELHEETRAFSQLQIYWAKSYKPHMIDIGKALGHLSHTYVAFQSMDPVVLEKIKRRNIEVDQLLHLIVELNQYSDHAQTDIMLGLPGETYNSHLNSLDRALGFGINHIQAGEIRLLPGSEMETDESRREHGLKTKYRLFEGGYGIYRGRFIYELEEGVRETNTMSEEEMLKLRGIRCFFYASVTLGEHLPILPYLNKKNVRVTQVCEEMIEAGRSHAVFGESVGWLLEKIHGEWFPTEEAAAESLSRKEEVDSLLHHDMFVKLNTGFLAKVCLDPKQYDAFYEVFETVVKRLVPDEDPAVLEEMIGICRESNFLVRCLNGRRETRARVGVMPATHDKLVECGLLSGPPCRGRSAHVDLEINETTAQSCIDYLDANPDVNFMELSQMLHVHRGRFLMKPVEAGEEADRGRLLERIRETTRLAEQRTLTA